MSSYVISFLITLLILFSLHLILSDLNVFSIHKYKSDSIISLSGFNSLVLLIIEYKADKKKFNDFYGASIFRVPVFLRRDSRKIFLFLNYISLTIQIKTVVRREHGEEKLKQLRILTGRRRVVQDVDDIGLPVHAVFREIRRSAQHRHRLIASPGGNGGVVLYALHHMFGGDVVFGFIIVSDVYSVDFFNRFDE